MGFSETLRRFRDEDLTVVNDAVTLAEDLTSEGFKMSFTQWRRRRYDVKTLADLREEEIVHGPFAQIIRYVGRKADSVLGSSQYDFYKICLQDHGIMSAIEERQELSLFPFVLYIVCHELIHVIRFTTFLQAFEASPQEKMLEEAKVHELTQSILASTSTKGMKAVLRFYRDWRGPLDRVREM
jgi:hypothetical protein